MKINFEKFRLKKGVAGSTEEKVDVRRVFANELYDHGQGIAFHALALKVYNSQGEEEYSDEEVVLMVEFSKQCMTPAFLDSLISVQQNICNYENEDSVISDEEQR